MERNGKWPADGSAQRGQVDKSGVRNAFFLYKYLVRIRRLLLTVKGGNVSLTVCKQSGLFSYFNFYCCTVHFDDSTIFTHQHMHLYHTLLNH
jgi:hypothetical protein